MNGKHGDHPLTDIINYGLTVFSEEVDALVRELDRLGARRELDRIVGTMYDHDPAQLASQLKPLRDRLRREAKERGWEID